MNEKSFIIRGNICYSEAKEQLSVTDRGYLVCCKGISRGVYPVIPDEYRDLPVKDYGDRLVIPGMTDLHVHAPQYPFRGLGMDLELLDWLNTHTFPEESRYAELEYAEKAYQIFVDDLKKSASTRAVIFATIHIPATEFLMKQLDAAGLKTYVGKVNMDQNCTDTLREKDAEASLDRTAAWLRETAEKYPNTRPILTPRFAPTCSGPLLEGLGKLQKKYGLPVQSHLSENLSEIAWVQELFPWSSCYGNVYEHYGLFGKEAKTVMAHCVHSSDREVELMKRNGVYVAHCPQSNINLSSGIAPIRRYLEEGIPTGLGTDMAGGANMSMFRCMADAIGVSKLYWRLADQSRKPLTMEEAFFLATKGGGSFFGKTGSFEEGYEVDALVLDDSGIRTAKELNTKERLERYIYLAEEGGQIVGKYVAGKELLLS
ncbi:guanine deaminase [Lachnospiraceae bacterium]|jgi:guanine deaminase|nr:amidohydrolase family protein [uncultured Schaedlerella sp.]MCI9152704.1 amidohydrolase family protein [Ruminococcus sp.]NBI59419.1 guanine deaminase [Lachnospiraceae bacterium]